MKNRERILQSFIWLAIVCSSLLVSCQNEDVGINTGANSQTLNKTSSLTKLLSRVSMENTGDDNVLDSTSCFKVKLPVDVVLNGEQAFTVNFEEDYGTVAEILQTATGYGSVDFIFPITVVFPDYSEQLVTSQEQFDQLSNCGETNPEEAPIGCFSIQYPVTIFGYNSNFQIAQTYVVDNDLELFLLILNLQENEYYSISYPISVSNSNGETIVINNNSELEALILQTIPLCFNPEPTCPNPHILINDLIIYMPFANQIKDLISMDYGITTATDTVFVEDRSGNANSAISFSGANDHLKLLANEIRNIEQFEPMSVSVWIKMQNTNPSNLEGIFERISEVSTVNQPAYGLCIFDLNAPFFYGYGNPDVAEPINVWDTSWGQSVTLPTDVTNWHHIVVTVEFSAGNEVPQFVKLYRDGVLRNSGETEYSSFVDTQVLDFFIGKGFQGYMDDLRVYNRVLTAQEVNILFELEGDTNTCF